MACREYIKIGFIPWRRSYHSPHGSQRNCPRHLKMRERVTVLTKSNQLLTILFCKPKHSTRLDRSLYIHFQVLFVAVISVYSNTEAIYISPMRIILCLKSYIYNFLFNWDSWGSFFPSVGYNWGHHAGLNRYSVSSNRSSAYCIGLISFKVVHDDLVVEVFCLPTEARLSRQRRLTQTMAH